MRVPPPPSATAERILDVAERLVQTQGYNGFSYADVSAALRISKASLHYHFPTKAKLGLSLVLRYQEAFRSALEAIRKSVPAPADQLRAYVQLYADVLRKDRMCLCGMLAAEQATLPKPMKAALNAFFDANEAWLADVLEEGHRTAALRVEGSVVEEARLFVASLEGAMLVARSYGDSRRFVSAAERVLAGVLPSAQRFKKGLRQA
jgi:TetR/AcrR family transcriptional regulator, transcriptional repressor for nem operon